jgi:hypothetical protein
VLIAGVRNIEAGMQFAASGCDITILDLFRDWMAAERAAAATSGDNDGSEEQAAFQAAYERSVRLIENISEIPVSAAGVAIKAFLLHHLEQGSNNKDAAALAAFLMMNLVSMLRSGSCQVHHQRRSTFGAGARTANRGCDWHDTRCGRSAAVRWRCRAARC